MFKKIYTPMCALLLLTALVSPSTLAAVPPPAPGLSMVDEKSTPETASLFNYLRKTSGKGLLFGHQHETTQGLTITDPASLVGSDTKAATGDYAAVYGWDTLSIIGDKSEGDVTEHVKAAYRRGGIITISGHLPNPQTGGNSWDTTIAANNALPGGDKNAVFNSYLDDVANFALNMKDDNGKLIPMMFRIMHENTGNWFWWGGAQTSPAEYIALYRYVVEYLRDKRGVHNFIYTYSPTDNLGSISEAAYLERYPGDAYVDVLGFDSYGPGLNNAAYMQTVVKYAALVSKMAQARGKISAIAEIGISADDVKAGNVDPLWYTKLLTALKSDPDAKKVAYMLVWRNGYAEHFWVPVAGVSPAGAVDDFVAFYNDPYTLFNREVVKAYSSKLPVNDQATFAYLVTPVNLATVAITDSSAKLRARLVDTAAPGAVTVKLTNPQDISFPPIEYNLALADSGYYEADLGPSLLNENNLYKLDLSVISADKIPPSSSRILVPSSAPVNPNIVEDFEGYYGTNDMLAARFGGAGGDGAVLTLDNNLAQSGSYGAKLTYNLKSNGYAGVSKSLADLDWKDNNTVRFWMAPDNKGQVLVIQMVVNGIYFEAYRILGATAPVAANSLNVNAKADTFVPQVTSAGWVDVPFGEFVRAPWETKTGKFNPKLVKRFSFYLNALPTGTQVDGSVLGVDHIYALNIPGNGDFTNVDPVIPPTSVGTLFDFETGTEGWTGQANWTGALDTTQSTDWKFHGESSLLNMVDLTTVDSYALQVFQAITLGGSAKIKVRVNVVDAGVGVKAKLFVKDGSWAWSDSGEVAVADGGTELTIDVSSLPSLNAIGVQFSGFDKTQTAAKFYIDYITLVKTTATLADGLFDFETDIDGWHGQMNWSGNLPADISANWANTGAKSALNTVDLTAANSYAFQVFRDVTLAGKTTVKLRVKTVNAGTGLKAKLFVKNSSWAWSDGGLVDLTGDSTELSIDVSALTQLKSIGVEFVGYDRTQTAAEFYVDSVVLQ